MKRIVVAITGATGAIYGVRLLEALRQAPEAESHLVISRWGRENIELETGFTVSQVEALADYCYGPDDLAAPLASGSFRRAAMVVVPCSMKTLAAIAQGQAADLVSRAADVALKEQTKLILAVRETPLNAIHLENMLKLARLGAVIMPPMPSYYHQPKSLGDLERQFTGRLLDQLDVDHQFCRRWGEAGQSGQSDQSGQSGQ